MTRSTLTFDDAYRLFGLMGATTIPHRTLGGVVVDIWASELVSGNRKGLLVLRVQWGNSSSTVDEYQWERPANGTQKRLLSAINAFITLSPSFKNCIATRLVDASRPLSANDRSFLESLAQATLPISRSDWTIDTLAALEAAHKVMGLSIHLHESQPEESTRLMRVSDEGFSAVVPYLRHRDAPVQEEHHAAIQKLLFEASKIKEKS